MEIKHNLIITLPCDKLSAELRKTGNDSDEEDEGRQDEAETQEQVEIPEDMTGVEETPTATPSQVITGALKCNIDSLTDNECERNA
jgi:hypothetical protein